MGNRMRYILVATLTGAGAAASLAQAPVIYPAKNQSAAQQQKDSGDCAAWAKQNTGIDPAVLAAAPAPAAETASTAAPAKAAPSGPSGERARGAARGAVAGAAVGEITDSDTGDAAGVGAVTGAVAAGGRERRDKRGEAEQAAQQQQQAAEQQKQAAQEAEAKKQEQLATYNRANAACLEGRGYTVK